MNAGQAMPGGGVIRVGADNAVLSGQPVPTLPDGPYVRLYVEDSGRGIPQEDVPRIFDPFFTTRAEGHGLGLSISHSIIKKHGGLITVDSRAGKGTVFNVYLPARLETAEAEKAGTTAGGHGARVLLVDDERMIVDSVTRGLELSGYEVEPAGDGAEAVQMYGEAMEGGRPYDAVVLDLTIPGGMGGKETIGLLRGLDPEVRAVVASGYSNDSVMSNFRDYGFRGVIAKPYLVEDLVRLLVQVLSGG
jgi:CheY-like chemotaxis protein